MEIQLEELLKNNSDLTVKKIKSGNLLFKLYYFPHSVDSYSLHESVIKVIQNRSASYPSKPLASILPIGEAVVTEKFELVKERLIQGWVFLFQEGNASGLLLNLSKIERRAVDVPSTQDQVFGPKAAFTESLDVNTSLIRSVVRSESLHVQTFEIGKRNKRSVRLFYLYDVASEQNVNTVSQRITDLEIDGVEDISQLVQFLDDNSFTIFPQTLLTERPDLASISLNKGRIALLMEGSSFAAICPVSFMDFFKSSDDYYYRWNIASFARLLRIFAILLSFFFTPIYVAILTYHYEMIPSAMLVSLAQSRARVPFPPLVEALILEFIIEFLREAGTRLPQKVGQTMSIVGGIVIGQAAVQAGFTSNILIMIVALGALASFTVPFYLMGSALRIIRFPMILLAGIWGSLGIVFGFSFLLVHLLRQTSFGNPYFFPFYPFRMKELKDSMIRAPFSSIQERTIFTRPNDTDRFSKKNAKRKKNIDESGDIL